MLAARFFRERRMRAAALRCVPPLRAPQGSGHGSGWSHVRSISASPDRASSPPQITLTPAESNLFDFLVYIQHLYAPTTQLRVAGGWVRDKLRGAESDDIDIVLDNINGTTFANHILKFQKMRKLPQSSIGVVKANSDKSKHLEVATVSIEGRMVDLVHLRAEEYTADSRIPETTFAKPIEDASRRDITINALFYNLHTQQVEDFTGQGLQDLAAGVVRTPLEPYQTFLDDPLRVLRAIRFACDFGYTLDEKLSEAVLTHAEIKDAMARKVSRERIGIEVRKMLSGSDPARAFSLLREYGLLDLVFNDLLKQENDANAAATTSHHPVRLWSDEVATKSFTHLQFLQQSRRELASHQISFVEASGAILTPLFLKSIADVSGPPSLEPLEPVGEDVIIDSAFSYLNVRDAITRQLPVDEIVEVLKTNVKWPKPAAKRVAFIIEAVAAFPSDARFSRECSGDRLKLFMWMTRYNSVLAPALSILLTQYEDPLQRDATLKTFLDLGAMYAKREAEHGGKKRRMDGNTIKTHLGDNAGPKIARALEVLNVWEMVHPLASVDDEVAFFEQLARQLE
uniref:Poly A polymerase head domain-containing protein n=1 Tax=Globisporangium ultimum (strain ATCC 200006 / CBS 805.95 / DAOM BR144) TaxID=431595 RepID=K3WQW5_GLOUD